ncbi:MAG: hypothetical protein J6S54_06250 [Lentisphaeria bacterium]|nr:hypothetical protein [Lentisphaeria bacterium]
MNDKKKYWDDFLNPVLVKEMRQFFHNRLLLSLAGGLLGVQLLVLFVFNLTFSEWKEFSEAGTVFIVIDTALMYLCVLAVAVWDPMNRFIAERSSKELDFSNITLLSPWQIVGGKLASALVIWGLIASLCLPFMTVAYFFRNVTLKDILLIFGAGVMPALVLIQAALFCGSLGKKWVQALFVYFVLQVIGPLTIVSLAPMLDHRNFGFINFCIFQGGWLMLFAMLLAATIAMITPPFSNRMMPLRILLCILLVPLLITAFFMETFHREPQYLILFMIMGATAFSGFLAVCDRDEPGGRVLAQVPRNPAGRFLHYLFSSNRCGGVVFSLILLLIFALVSVLLAARMKEAMALITFSIAAYIICYCEIAIILNRKVPSMPGWGWLLVVSFALGVIPMVAAANSDIKVSQIWISPCSLLGNGRYHHTVTDPAIWAAPLAAWGIGLLFVIEMFRKYKNYKAPEKKSNGSALQGEEKKI